jgi:predicted 3-demethylubiquinone-9 3-methyltransferase (glyoxalase superfamily)
MERFWSRVRRSSVSLPDSSSRSSAGSFSGRRSRSASVAAWNAIVDSGGEESACGWCKDRWGFSWQITPRVLLHALNSPDAAAAKRAFDAMMPMTKIDIAAIEAALRGETADT